MNRTLNISEVAKFIGVSRRTLYNMIDDGRFAIKPIRGTAPRRWNSADVLAWMKRK